MLDIFPDYSFQELNEGNTIKETIDCMTRGVKTKLDSSRFFIDGTGIYGDMLGDRNNLEFDDYCHVILTNLLRTHQEKLDQKIIDYIISCSNLDGFVGLLELNLRAEMNSELLDKVIMRTSFNLDTKSHDGVVMFKESVDVSSQANSRIMHIECSSKIFLKDGQVRHEFHSGNENVQDRRWFDKLFQRQENDWKRSASNFLRSISAFFSSGNGSSNPEAGESNDQDDKVSFHFSTRR